ncbi:uncharacterized protein GGS25DRAFT_61759 [Hypoxylon fragiforme]|uniref:uncharacterized protein n=1 Tax=Hypoxylon fragiforme TaxID=63214 RepID=UPI0020C6E48E|nr:uncharacterized protein GGS25DRAFT_61759 [Hypoxylon fragiforme]KAI2614688.1 hypothetical protein GGS25DRAFT_61759 [Hypoxylon fragiforme]
MDLLHASLIWVGCDLLVYTVLGQAGWLTLLFQAGRSFSSTTRWQSSCQPRASPVLHEVQCCHVARGAQKCILETPPSEHLPVNEAGRQ